MSKYLGTEAGLIGPVQMDKPVFNKLDLKNKLSILRYNDAASKYTEHLASLPVLPCEGWKPEVGREYVEGVEFRRDELITLEGGKEISRRIVAVPIPAAPQEGAQEGLNLKQIFENNFDCYADQHDLSLPVMAMTCGKFTEVVTGILSAQPAPTYPAEFVEWVVKTIDIEREVNVPELFTEWKRIKEQSK